MDFSSEMSNNNHDSALDLFEKPVFCENFQSQTNIVIQPTVPPGGKKSLNVILFYCILFRLPSRQLYVHNRIE